MVRLEQRDRAAGAIDIDLRRAFKIVERPARRWWPVLGMDLHAGYLRDPQLSIEVVELLPAPPELCLKERRHVPAQQRLVIRG